MSKKPESKTETQLKEQIEKKVQDTPKKARPNYYWVRAKVTDGDVFGLDKYGLSKWRDTIETVPCAYDHAAKKWLTGLDENDPKFFTILDEKERTKKQKEVKELRLQLEALTGLDLSPTNNDFWGNYLIVLSDNTRPFVPHLNPRDRIAIEVLKRRGDIPFGSHDLFNANYADAKFYIETEEAEANTRTNKRKLEKEALAASFNMENEYDRLWKVCYLLGLTKRVNESTQSLVEKVDEFIEKNKKYADELEKFIKYATLDIQKLDAISYFRKAVKAGVIKFDRENKIYYRGGFNMKTNEFDSAMLLLMPENTTYYIEIMEEVQRKEGVQADTA